jgi:hypothetical protein
MLQGDQIRRYARHVLLPDVGGVGQARLLASTVAIDPRDPAERIAFDYCAASGVGTIALLVDDPALIARAAALNPDVRVIVSAEGPRLPHVDETDSWVQAGAAATMLLHRIATTP